MIITLVHELFKNRHYKMLRLIVLHPKSVVDTSRVNRAHFTAFRAEGWCSTPSPAYVLYRPWPVWVCRTHLGQVFVDKLLAHKLVCCQAQRQCGSRTLFSKPLRILENNVSATILISVVWISKVKTVYSNTPCASLTSRSVAAKIDMSCSACRHLVMWRDTCLSQMRRQTNSSLVKYILI
jgi:hypothetical protein